MNNSHKTEVFLQKIKNNISSMAKLAIGDGEDLGFCKDNIFNFLDFLLNRGVVMKWDSCCLFLDDDNEEKLFAFSIQFREEVAWKFLSNGCIKIAGQKKQKYWDITSYFVKEFQLSLI